MSSNDEIKFEIKKDFGGFGEGKWQKHLTLISWNGGEPKYDIRPWNEDMTKMGKGVTLTLEDVIDLMNMFEDILDKEDSEKEGHGSLDEEYSYQEDDGFYDEE